MAAAKPLGQVQQELDLATIQTLVLALAQVVRRAEITHTFQHEDKTRLNAIVAATNGLTQRMTDPDAPQDRWLAQDLADVARMMAVCSADAHTYLGNTARLNVARMMENQHGIPNQLARAQEQNQHACAERGLRYNPADYQ